MVLLQEGAQAIRVRWDEEGTAETTTLPTPVGVDGALFYTADGSRLLRVTGPATIPATLQVLDSVSGVAQRTVTVRKGIRSLAVSPDSRYVLLQHAPHLPPSPATEIERQLAQLSGFSLVDVSTGAQKLIPMPGLPQELAFSEDGTWAFATSAGPGGRAGHLGWIDTVTFASRELALDSAVESIGWLEDIGRLWVLQSSSAGRLGFLDPSDGRMAEVSAFALNAFVE
jgi:hypothetical protein